MARKSMLAPSATITVTRYLLTNARRVSCVYDLEGHSLGARERVTVDVIDEVGQRAIDRHYLYMEVIEETVEVPDPEPEPTPEPEPIPDPTPDPGQPE